MINLHFLHGFLGLPSDWNAVKEDFNDYHCIAHSIENYILDYSKISISRPDSLVSVLSGHVGALTDWAHRFNHKVFSNPSYCSTKNILIGYSLGGRLALHSLRAPNQWDAAILISTHPGLTNASEKQQRLQHDVNWGDRFASEPWESILDAWNDQAVFAYKKNVFRRSEEHYDRTSLQQVLNMFSLGLQNGFQDFIKNIQIPILWVAGEQDAKFAKIAEEMSQLSCNVKHAIIPNSGHRVPWESQGDFTKICNDFLKDLYILHT